MKRGFWRIIILLPLLVSLFFGGVSPAYAAVLLVDVGGGGGYTTIGAAVAAAQPGDVIQIKSGAYTESISLSFSGNLTLEAIDGPGTVTLNGGISGSVAGALTLNGIKFQSPGDALSLTQVTNLLVVDCTFASPTTNAISLALSSGAGTVALYNNTFSGPTGVAVGIDISGSANYDLTAVDNKVNSSPTMPMVFGVVARGNSQARLTIQGSTIAGVKGGGPAMYLQAQENAQLYASVHNNSLSNVQTANIAAIYLRSESAQPATFDVTNNQLMVVRDGAGILLDAMATGAVSASIVENTLFGIGLRTSGNAADRGIEAIAGPSFSGLANIAILNNTLDLVDSSGIYVEAAGGQMDANVLGNTLDATNRYGLESDFYAQHNASAALNLNLQNNTFPASGGTANLINTGGTFNLTTDGSDVTAFLPAHNVNLPVSGLSLSGLSAVTSVPTAPTLNRPPAAADDAPSAVAKTATLLDVLANDTDPDGTTPSLGFFTPDSFQDGAATQSGSQISYTSPSFYLTSDTLYYIASDGRASDIAKVAVNVLPYPSPDLVISKVPGGAFFQGQTNATYTLTVQNNGQIATSGPVLVVDSLPSGLTLTDMSGAGWSCTVATRTCTRSDALAPGATYPIILVTASVAYDAPPVLTNTANVAYDGEYNTTNNTASAITTIGQKPDLTLSKSHSGSFTQGQTGATFTLTAHNSGFAPSVGAVTVADTLPVGLTATAFSGVNWNCTLSPLSCAYSGPAIAAGADFPPLTLTVNVAADAADSLKNQADVSGGGETRTDNNHAEDTVSVVKVADLTITKSHTDPFYQGQTGAAYILHVTNLGPGSTAGAVAVDDTLPAGLTATAFSGTGWTCTLSPLHCTNSSVVAAGVAFDDLTLTVNVAFDAPAVITNTATVSGGGELVLTNDTANDPTNVTQKPDLTIVKSHTGNFAQGQTGATYNIVVTNNGYAPTSGAVTVVDTLPAGLTATDISGTGWSCTLATLTCTRSDELAVGVSYPAIVVTVNVAIGAPASVTNSATVSGGGETRTDNDTASDPTTIIQSADLTVSKTHGSNFIQGQTGATFSITVRNGGVGPTAGTVTVTDTLPSGLTATAFSGTGWSCSLSPLRCTSSDIVAAGANFPILTLTVNVASNAPASVVNTVRVGGGGEFDLTNDTAADTVLIDQLPDLTISKSHSGNFREGQIGALYTITVRNSGGAPTTGLVTVIDTLPAGLTATAMSGTDWACDLPTWTCTYTGAPVAANTNFPAITLTVNVATDTGPSLTNTATVSGGGETRTDNDTANNPTNIDQVADLTLAKSHTGNFSQGQIGAAFTLTVTNAGQGPTIGTTTVVDTLPVGLTATAISGSGWTCDLPTLTCTSTAAIPAGGNFPPLTLTVNVALNATSPQINQAAVSGGGELNTANDAASDSATINQAANLVLTKIHTGNFFQGQTGATYTLRVQNTGTVASDGSQVTLVDTLPAGLTATALGGTGWTCDLPTLTCTRSNPLALGVGAFYEDILLTVNVAPTAPASLTNTATVSGGGEAYTPDSTASDPTTIDGRADLTITKTHTGAFRQGSTGQTFSLTVSNQGRADSSGTVTVIDTLPAGLTATAISGTGWTCTLATLTCTRSDALTGGASYPAITLTVDVAADAAPLLINQASVTLPGEVTTGNNTAQDGVTTIPVADLTISKTHTGTFRQGQQGAAYILTVSNPGPGPTLGDVIFTDTLPTGLSYAGVTANGWTCTNPQPQSVVCTRSDVIASGASYPALTLLVNVAENAPASVTNSVIVGGGGQLNPLNDSASDPTTIVQAADLTISKTHTGSFTQGQAGATYTLHVANLGPGATDGPVTVDDALPAGLTATAFSGTGWVCSLSPLRCTNAAILAAGASYPDLTLTVDVAADAPAQVTNTATVSGGGEINAANDTASDPTVIILRADLRLSKTANLSQVVPGQTFQYVLTFSNQGMGTAHNVVITDILPTGFQVAGVAATGVIITDTGHVPAYVWQVQDLAQGQSGSITIVGAFAQGTLPQTVANQADIASSAIEAAPANNRSQIDVSVVRATTQMTLVYSPAAPIIGQSITFTATVQTVAPVTIQATGLVTFTEGATVLGTGALNASGQAILTTSSLSAGPHTITASYPGDALHAPSTATVTLNVRPQADLSISLSVTPSSILSGKSVTFKAAVANLGPLEAPGTLVEMALPAGFAFEPAGSSAGCTANNGLVSCTLASLAANQQTSFDIVVNVTGQAPSGTTVFTAKASSQAIDLVPANNTATASLNVIGFLNTYFNDFEQPVGAEWCQTRRDATPIGKRNFLGQFGNETACLTLNGLIPHQSVAVTFDLYLIRSWNGNSDDRNGQARSTEMDETLGPDGTLGPDRWMLTADGQTVLDTTFAVWPDDLQSFPYAFKMGAFPRFTQAAENRTLGYYFALKANDAVYHLTYVFPHTASSLELNFLARNLQSLENESWGLDNVQVSLFGQLGKLFLPVMRLR